MEICHRYAKIVSGGPLNIRCEEILQASTGGKDSAESLCAEFLRFPYHILLFIAIDGGFLEVPLMFFILIF